MAMLHVVFSNAMVYNTAWTFRTAEFSLFGAPGPGWGFYSGTTNTFSVHWSSSPDVSAVCSISAVLLYWMDAVDYVRLGGEALVPRGSVASRLRCRALSVAFASVPLSFWRMLVAGVWPARCVVQPYTLPSLPPPSRLVFRRKIGKARRNPFPAGICFPLGCCWDRPRGVDQFELGRFVVLSGVDILSLCRGEWSCDTAIGSGRCAAGAKRSVSSSLLRSYGTAMPRSETVEVLRFLPRLCRAEIQPSRLDLGFPPPAAD